MTAVAMAFVRSAALAVIIAHSGGTRRACLNTAHTPQSRFPPVGIVSLQKRSDDMGVFRVNKNKNYTVMSNVHLRDKALPLKAKGLLSLMLSLPEDWDYSMRGLAKLSADGLDSTRAAVKALERSGYVVRRQLYDSRGRFSNNEYTVFEIPQPSSPSSDLPLTGKPSTEKSPSDAPLSEKPSQINTDQVITQKRNTDLNNYQSINLDGMDRMDERSEYEEIINNSYGLRPNHSVENAIARSYQLLQHANLHYVIEFDIKGFFDNVNHAKLIRQIWAMGIHDKKLIFLIKRILKAPIRLEDGTTVTPDKGTPQGGIISPLLANIVLNELDHWVESQWQWCPICKRNTRPENGYRQAKKSNLKEMFIVRYADDFRIFCRTKDVAERTKCAVTLWLKERLKLEISEKKTRIVNVRNHYSEFLGFKMKVHRKGDKLVVMSHIADKNLEHKREKLKEQAKRIVHPRKIYGEQGEIRLYNSMVTGMQNYYCIATHVNHDCASLNRTIMTLLTNRLSTRTGNRLVKKGRELTAFEKARFGKSKMIRYVAGTNEPIYPIGYTQHKNPLFRKKSWNYYTPEGREGIHDCLRINVSMMLALMRMPTYSNSAEYADNRISLFSAQWGKCAVTGDEFSHIGEIHCHHKLPRHLGGDDSYGNLVLIKDAVHKLIHASNTETIHKYMDLLQLDSKRLAKVNNLRQLASMQPI